MNQLVTEERTQSIWNQVEGNWTQFKGIIKEKWNKLTDDDLAAMAGRQDQIIGKIQERYGEAQWKKAEIEKELQSYLEN